MAKDGTDVTETGDGVARREFRSKYLLETRRSLVSADPASQNCC
jgi:hypothetical protein